MIQTRKADPNKPYRALIYGPEGVGKSTLGAKAEKPIFISAEGGTDQLEDSEGNPIEEMPNVKTWDDVIKSVKDLTTQPHSFKTLTIDSADWLEALAHKKLLAGTNKTIITVLGGYNAGYRATQNMFQELVEALSEMREKRKMNTLFTAHAHVKPVKDPEMMIDYDQFEIKLNELSSSVLREWVDMLLFARFKTHASKDESNKRGRAYGGDDRVLYTVKRPAFQAKNRYGLPAEIDFTMNVWDELMPYIRKGTTTVAEERPHNIIDTIDDLTMKLSDPELVAKVGEQIVKAGKDQAKLQAILKRLRTLTKTKGES